MVGNRVAFTAFGKEIYWYGVIIAAAVLLGALTASVRERRAGLPRDTAVDFALIGMPIAIVFARLYYVAFEWPRYRGDLLSVLDVRSGGLAIYGGVIGGALAALIVCKKKRVCYGALADLVAPSLALGQAIGRWGNFCNQEAYGGLVANARWQFFPAAVYIEALGEWRWAAFFYESVWCLFIWLLLEILVRRGAFSRGRPGDVFWWYALLYAAERAVVEGLRSDSLYLGSVRVSQALSCTALLFVCALFFFRARERSGRLVALFCACAASAGWVLLMALGAVSGGTWQMLALCAAALNAALAVYRSALPGRGEGEKCET